MPSTRVLVLDNGERGPKGDPGAPGGGTPGQGVPTGGTTGQALVKNSSTNYDTSWQTISGGLGSVASTDITDSTTVGRAVLTAANAAAARSAIGAAPTDAATTSASGLVELATDTEATTGTDTVRAVTPHGLAATIAALRADDSLIQTTVTENTGLIRRQGTSGAFVSLTDASNTIVMGVDRTGAFVINGIQTKLLIPWQEGGPDLTVGGTKPIPPGMMPLFMLTSLSNLPSWATGLAAVVLVATPAGGEVIVGKFYGSGIADNHALVAGDGGTSGDTTVTSISGAGSITVQTDEGTVNPAVQIVTSANAVQAVYGDGTAVGTSTTRSISFKIKTPSAFSAAFAIMSLQSTGTLQARVSISASGAPRMVDSAAATVVTGPTAMSVSTWYHFLYQVTQNGTSSVARLRVWPAGHAPLDTPFYDSGNQTFSGGTNHNQIAFGTAGSGTVNYFWAKARWNNDATSYLSEG